MEAKKIKKVGADMEGTRCLQDAYASVLSSGGPTWGRGGLRYSGHCKSGCEDIMRYVFNDLDDLKLIHPTMIEGPKKVFSFYSKCDMI